MCLFDTAEVVRTMAEPMEKGEGSVGCKSSVVGGNALSPTDFYKGEREKSLAQREWGMGGQIGGPLPPAAQTSEY